MASNAGVRLALCRDASLIIFATTTKDYILMLYS